MSFQELRKAVQEGMDGRNNGIPMGFDRLNRYIGIRKSMYTLIGGLTGSGKTSFVDDAYVLNPFDWYISKYNKTNFKLKIIYRSMERSRTYKLSKWVSRKIFLDHGIVIPVNKLLGWTEKMSKDEHDLFLMYEDYMGEMSEVMTIIDGPENPVGIAKELKTHALKNGKIEQLDEYNKIYVPNNDNEITIVIIDHIGLLKTTTAQPTKKDAIDKMSDELRYARDFYGYTPVVVSQFNRSISNPQRLKNGDVEPQLEDKLRDDYGAKYFRSLRLIKNSYGEDDVRIGLGFLGQIGMFKELPRQRDMTEENYISVTNKTFFLK
jgi:hypothetical protein